MEKSDQEQKPDGNDDAASTDGDGGGVDKGPSLCSVDQSAITGESLAVEKIAVSIVVPEYPPANIL